MAELLQSAAFLSDRAEVLPIDITLLAHCLWSDETQRETIQSLLEKAIKDSTHYAESDELERIEGEYSRLYDRVREELYKQGKPQRVSQERKESYTLECDRLIESSSSMLVGLGERLDTERDMMSSPFVSKSDYKLVLQDIIDLQERARKIHIAATNLNHIITTQPDPMLAKCNTKKPLYRPRSKQALKELIEDSSINLGEIDTSVIKNMNRLFYETKRTDFSGIEYWDVSRVEDMSSMFWGVKDFNEPLGAWNVSNVKNMNCMFWEAKSFNQPLNSWNVEKVVSMRYMFVGALNFNQPLDSWNVSNVRNMVGMFKGARSFHQVLDSWKVGDKTDTGWMFDSTKCPRPQWFKEKR